MDVRRRLGLNLKRLREEHGLRQESSADHCGRYRTYISGIEVGVRNSTVVIFDKIAKALRVTEGQLLDESTSWSYSPTNALNVQLREAYMIP
jgi:transcriptional regulator with XRE-family HTH domain